MKNFIRVLVNCFLGSVITTGVILVASFIVMIFRSGDDGMRQCYFNTLFFNPVTQNDGSVNITFGFTEKYVPILITVFVIFWFYLCTYVIYKRLIEYRRKLMDQK